MKTSINQNRESHKIYGGIALVIMGSIFMLDNFGASIPEWVLSWPMLLIVIGLVSGTKHQFSRPGAFILIGLGILFLLKKFFFISISLFPLFLIGAGLWIILKRHSHSVWKNTQQC
ncbi:MAG: hypothetical protein K0S09_2703 [Sphingobacteriaceae bacterium]|jgi:hypothetical protein|nr:hypothetical protein [Sphingobacteriaceae bacterium]